MVTYGNLQERIVRSVLVLGTLSRDQKKLFLIFRTSIRDEQARPTPTMTPCDGLFLSKLSGNKIEILTQLGYRLQNRLINFKIKNFVLFLS